MSLRHDALLSEMARQALAGDQAAHNALLDRLQELPWPEESKYALSRPRRPSTGTARFVWQALASRVGVGRSPDRSTEGLILLHLALPSREAAGGLVAQALRRGDVRGWPAAFGAAPSPHHLPHLLRLAFDLSLPLLLGHCPWRRPRPWLMGLLDRPAIGLAVYTWRES